MSEPISAYRKPKAVTIFERFWSLSFGEFLIGRFAEIAPPIEFSTSEHHPTKNRGVPGGGKKPPCRHGKATVAIGERRGELAEGEGFQIFLGRVRSIGLGETLHLFFVRPKGSVFHSERGEEALLHEVFVLGAGHDFDDAGGGVDAGVGILIMRSWLGLEREMACLPPRKWSS